MDNNIKTVTQNINAAVTQEPAAIAKVKSPDLPASESISPPVFVPKKEAEPVDPFSWTDIKDVIRLPNGYQCSVKFVAWDEYVTFLACADDVEAHGRAIYEKCHSGDLGKVPDYFPTDAELLVATQERIQQQLATANAEVTKYQDRVDVDDATDADRTQLKAWKTYRVALNKLDQQKGWPAALTWPVPPAI